MNGWMFFSPDKYTRQRNEKDFDMILELFPGMGPLSAEEWHAYMPESRERAQGPTLGFLCHGEAGKKLSSIPDYPMRVFVSEYTVTPECWNRPTSLTAEVEPVENYRIQNAFAYQGTITVTGMLPNCPPSFRVYGSYCFFPPPYRLANDLEKPSDRIFVTNSKT